MDIVVWAQEAIFIHTCILLYILNCLGQDMQVLYLGRALRTKETLPDFLKWRRVTRRSLVFRGLTGSQRTLGFRGVTQTIICRDIKEKFASWAAFNFALNLITAHNSNQNLSRDKRK